MIFSHWIKMSRAVLKWWYCSLMIDCEFEKRCLLIPSVDRSDLIEFLWSSLQCFFTRGKEAKVLDVISSLMTQPSPSASSNRTQQRTHSSGGYNHLSDLHPLVFSDLSDNRANEAIFLEGNRYRSSQDSDIHLCCLIWKGNEWRPCSREQRLAP